VSDSTAVPYPALPATSWAVLGMLTFGEELSGNDLKKWADWGIGYFYWSPSVSQIYGELKKLESLDLVRSRSVAEPGIRGRRLYAITEAGVAALRGWTRNAPVETPVLKHSVVLRLHLGHLGDPENLKAVLREYISKQTEAAEQIRRYIDHSGAEPGWAYPRRSLRWAERYMRSEIELATQMIDEIDDAAAEFRECDTDEMGLPHPAVAESWMQVEQIVARFSGDAPAADGSV
jgi:DNA-binding PadR family transcriptional regulator